MIIHVLSTLLAASAARADLGLAFAYHVFDRPPFASYAEIDAFKLGHDLDVLGNYPDSEHWLVAPASFDHEYEAVPIESAPPTEAELAHGAWMRPARIAGRLAVPFILPAGDAARLEIASVPITAADLVLRSYQDEFARVALPDAESVLAEVHFDRAFSPPRLTLSERMRFDLGRLARARVAEIHDEASLELEIVDPRTHATVRATLFVWDFKRGTRDFDRTFFMGRGRFADPTFLKLSCASALSRSETP